MIADVVLGGGVANYAEPQLNYFHQLFQAYGTASCGDVS